MDLGDLEYVYQKSVAGAERATIKNDEHVVMINVPSGETLVGWAVLPPALVEVSGCRFENTSTSAAVVQNQVVRAAVIGPSTATLRFSYDLGRLGRHQKRTMLDVWVHPPCGCCCQRDEICADQIDGTFDADGGFAKTVDGCDVEIVGTYVERIGVRTPSVIFYFAKTSNPMQ
jgi:hypothetical protein